MSGDKKDNTHRTDTMLAHSGRDPSGFHGFVNPPVVHASTVTFPDAETLQSGGQTYTYARRGNPTTDALEDALAGLEGAAGVKLANSGLNACALAIMSAVRTGDHMLIPDSCYGPTRAFADNILPRMGVSVEYYDPLIGAAIETLFKPETKAVYLEAPGSLTFEMQDIRAIADAAHKIDATVLLDNTWASPLYCKAIDLGVDLSIQAGTKYIVGHSDCMLGTIAASEKAWPDLDKIHGYMGSHVGPDDVYLGLRGLRTLSVRLERHQKNTLAVIDWLKSREEIAAIRYPALENDPGYALWKRDFTGASGLFAFDFKPGTTADQSRLFLNALTLFGLGYSWGGFESLAIPVKLKGVRTVTPVDPDRQSVRLHIGLEDPEDLIKDLKQAFEAAFQAA